MTVVSPQLSSSIKARNMSGMSITICTVPNAQRVSKRCWRQHNRKPPESRDSKHVARMLQQGTGHKSKETKRPLRSSLHVSVLIWEIKYWITNPGRTCPTPKLPWCFRMTFPGFWWLLREWRPHWILKHAHSGLLYAEENSENDSYCQASVL